MCELRDSMPDACKGYATPGLEPQTPGEQAGSQAGLLLTRASLALDSLALFGQGYAKGGELHTQWLTASMRSDVTVEALHALLLELWQSYVRSKPNDTFTTAPPPAATAADTFGMQLKKDDFVRALDSNFEWCDAKVVKVCDKGETREVRVHYKGFGRHLEKWIPVGEGRILPPAPAHEQPPVTTSDVEESLDQPARPGPASEGQVSSESLLQHVPSLRPPPAPPPHCNCGGGMVAVWSRNRWWCAREDTDGGCDYEQAPPPPVHASSPLCHCSVRCSWVQQRWWCAALRCGFEMQADPPHTEPTRVTESEITREMEEIARTTAAKCTAAAFKDANANPGADSDSAS